MGFGLFFIFGSMAVLWKFILNTIWCFACPKPKYVYFLNMYYVIEGLIWIFFSAPCSQGISLQGTTYKFDIQDNISRTRGNAYMTERNAELCFCCWVQSLMLTWMWWPSQIHHLMATISGGEETACKENVQLLHISIEQCIVFLDCLPMCKSDDKNICLLLKTSQNVICIQSANVIFSGEQKGFFLRRRTSNGFQKHFQFQNL